MTSIRLLLTTYLLDWAFRICPQDEKVFLAQALKFYLDRTLRHEIKKEWEIKCDLWEDRIKKN
jgi:hypothetical protein